MKKFLTIMLSVLVVVTCAFGLSACSCGNDTVYKAVKIEGQAPESYGFAVKKGTNANIISACNKVINADGFNEKLDELVAYYTAVYGNETPKALSFNLPDLSDNTAGTLKVGTEAGFAPFEFIDTQYGYGEGDVAGLDVALMMFVAEELNYKLSITDMNFNSLPAALASDQIDIIAAGYTKDDERLKTMDFSDNYFTSTQFIVCAADKDYDEIKDLKGLKIGVQMGTTGDFLVSDSIDGGVLKGSGAEVVPYQSITIAMQALKKGDIDVIVIDELPAKSLVK